MATFLLPRTSTVLGVGLGLSLSLSLYPASPFRSASSPIQCQYTAPYYRTDTQVSPETGWTVDRNDPMLRKQGQTSPKSSRWLTPRRMRQISLGSVLGLIAGVGLRAFSRTLAVVLGMGVVLVEVFSFLLSLFFSSLLTLFQWAASKGYNLLPLNWIQQSVSSVDVQRAVLDQMPLKVSFGVTMALAAFARFRE